MLKRTMACGTKHRLLISRAHFEEFKVREWLACQDEVALVQTGHHKMNVILKSVVHDRTAQCKLAEGVARGHRERLDLTAVEVYHNVA